MPLQPTGRYIAGIDVLPAPPPGWDSFETLMRLALAKAGEAAAAGEAPVGAAVLSGTGEVLATAANAPIALCDPTAHAEILALRAAAAKVGNYRLPGSILAVTLEPCVMCLGAMIHARVGLLIYGATDPKTGAVDSRLSGPDLPFFNHRFNVVSGVLAEDCSRLLTEFFRSRRRASENGADNACQDSGDRV